MAEETPDSPDDEFAAFRPSRAPWVLAFVALAAAAFSLWLYGHFRQRGLAMHGQGHLVVLPASRGGAWALFLDGTLVQLTPQSVQHLHAKTGPCEEIAGSLLGERLDLESLHCAPGSLQHLVGERLRWMGLKFEYFDKAEKFTGDTLERFLETPEVVASMLDPRPEWPQLIPLYTPLFPAALARARLSGRLPVPLLIEVHRDDLQIRRMTRTVLSEFLSRPTYHLAAGADRGGWIVRTLVVDPAASGDLEDLLLDPTAPPWPERLKATTVHVARRTPLPPALEDAAASPPRNDPDAGRPKSP